MKLLGITATSLALAGLLFGCSTRGPIYYQDSVEKGEAFRVVQAGQETDPEGLVRNITYRLERAETQRPVRQAYYDQDGRARTYGNPRYGNSSLGEWAPAPGAERFAAQLNGGDQRFEARLTSGPTLRADGTFNVRVAVKHDFLRFAELNYERVGLSAMGLGAQATDKERLVIRNAFALKVVIAAFPQFDRAKHSQALDVVDLKPRIRDLAAAVHRDKVVRVIIEPANVDSRVAFPGSAIRLQAHQPVSRAELLQPYFSSNTWLAYGESVFPPFDGADSQKETFHGTSATFSLVPGRYTLSVKNPGYYYLEQPLTVGRDGGKYSIYMAELGTKHRVKIVPE
jgi:hypothetical protein